MARKKKQIMTWCGWCGWRRTLVVVLYETGCCSFVKTIAIFSMQKMCHNFWGVLQSPVSKNGYEGWTSFLEGFYFRKSWFTISSWWFQIFFNFLPGELIHLDWYCSKVLKPPTSSPFKVMTVGLQWGKKHPGFLCNKVGPYGPYKWRDTGPLWHYKSIGKKRPA